MTLDVQKVRSHFPSLHTGYIFADNAGGSQVTRGVVDRITNYLLHSNVQLGADYSVSIQSTKRVAEGVVAAQQLFNAESVDEVVLGSSSTLNLENLARGLENDIKPGDEFIITGEHEANNGPWKKLAQRKGAVVKLWEATPMSQDNPYSVALQLKDVLPLITSKTRIVAFTACSNILGTLVPVAEFVKAIRKEAREKGSQKVEISIDCVAYAPHRRIDVQAWDIDFCVFSFYKVYGPHMSGLYVRKASLLNSVSALTHHFLPVDEISYKLQPGGQGYELVYSIADLVPYFQGLTPANTLDAGFAAIAEHEVMLMKPLIGFLTEQKQWDRGVRLVGQPSTSAVDRAPTISFIVTGQNAMNSRDVVCVFDNKGQVGIRYGHFYAYTLVDHLSPKIDPADGVVRISLVHYNTVQEVARIIEILKEALGV